MHHPEFPVISFIIIPLLLSSLPSHIRARSVATIALVAWLVVLNVIRGVNSLVWADNVIVRLEVWCDITTKILIGFTFAVPLAALCICRHLENVSSNRQAVITEADKRRRMKFEALMCFGLPMIFMALHYVVQGHRFDIIEDVGCSPSTYFSVPAVMIVWVPPLVISMVTLVYAVAAFHHFLQRRIEFAAILQSSNSAISTGRYFRLMALAVFEILWDSGTNIYILYYNTFTGLRPWISWENVHSNFSRVAVFPQFLLPSWAVTQLVWQWWIIPISSIAFFAFFGFGEEAMEDYRAAIFWLRRNVFRQNMNLNMPSNPVVLPTHCSRPGHICVSLPNVADDLSEHKPNAWDEMSLKMPDISESSALAFRPSLPDPVNCAPELGTLSSKGSSEQASEPQMLHSLDQSQRSTFSDSSGSAASMGTGHSSTRYPSHAHNPLKSIQYPETQEATGNAGSNTSILPRAASPVLHNVLSPATLCRQLSINPHITVSPAVLHDPDRFRHHHQHDFTPAIPSDAHAPSHGGIHITVEKSIS